MMSSPPPSSTSLRVADLKQTGKTEFSLRPDKDVLGKIAQEMGLNALRKLSFIGAVVPEGESNWRLNGHLGATLVQPCVVTLEPVTTRIEVDVTRLYSKDQADTDEPEAEMPEDDTIENLGTWIDPEVVMMEALALSIPEYPRLPEAELGSAQFTKPGDKPMTDEDARPFAGLAGLKDKLGQSNPDGDS